MKIVFVGAGGVGGYFGARLAASGAEVALIARGPHLAAIRANGLKIESPLGDLVQKIRAESDPATIGIADIVFLAVKLWDVEATVRQIAPLVGPETNVVSLQNGVEAPDMLRAAYGPERVLGGVAHIATTIAEPGTIRHSGQLARMTAGAFGRPDHPRIVEFVAIAKRAGVDAVASPDIAKSIWEKFVFLSALSAITASTRLPKGALWRAEATRKTVRKLVEECVAVARAEGVALAPDQADKTYSFIEAVPDGMKASMLHDLERGAKLELPWLSGAVVRLAEKHKLAAPTHAAIVGVLSPYAEGRPNVHP
ncbi:MAG: 2-dehydropantoate 2-reductase [Proteobacteria bacterium]|nr:2-dehydropantoate 2-reductase [Pseudomonadota bacterium]